MTHYIATPLEISTLALSPLVLPDWKTPIVDGNGALGRRQVENDVLCAVDPYLQMEEGDFIEVFFTSADRADAYRLIKPADKDKRLYFTIPRSQLVTRWYDNVYYRITRVSGGTDDSPKLRILVLLTQPGGTDKDPGTIGHSELHQILEADVLERGIDAERAKSGTWVTIPAYPYMRVNDAITLKWGGEIVLHKVSKAEAEAPDSNPIKIFISRTVIETAGSYIQLPVMFQPVDEAGNFPDDNGRWSTPSFVDVDLDDSKLVEPYVVEADFETGEIDLKKLNGKPVTVEVQTNRTNYKRGSKVALKWAGKTVDNRPIEQPFNFTVDEPGRTYSFSVLHANVKAIARGQAVVSYQVTTDGKLLFSKNAYVRVFGELNPLLAPSIDKANGTYLPPNLPKATASIPDYPGRSPNDLLILYIIGVRPGGGTELYEDARLVGNVPEGQPITRDLLTDTLARFDGLQITVLYEVHTDSVQESEHLLLTVGEPKKELPAPILEGATEEDVFDPDPPEREAIYQIPLILTTNRDEGTWHFFGFSKAGSTEGKFTLSTGSAARPIRIPLERRFIDLNQGHTVRMLYNLMRNGKLVYSQEREVRIGSPLPTLLEPSVLEAPNAVLDPNRYQDGFTVRVQTPELQAGDAIELTVDGRPGEGSSIPDRQFVGTQKFVDFKVAALITGANLGQVVNLSYKVIRLGQESPSKTLALNIGTLQQQSMPTPLFEGFSEGFLDIGRLQDATKVLCDKWPFQRFGLPVWLSYVEARADNTSRPRVQLVGAAHDQTSGLSYTTEVQWLRECKADSKLSIVLKVGLFKEATVSDAVECQARVYTVRTGLDKLTTFDRFNWDGWVPNASYPSQIVLEQGEYFVQSTNGYNYLIFTKSYDDIEIGEVYELSFKYQYPVATSLYVTRDGVVIHNATIPASSTWRTHSITFPSKNTSPASPMALYFQLGYAQGHSNGSSKIDEIRLRYVP